MNIESHHSRITLQMGMSVLETVSPPETVLPCNGLATPTSSCNAMLTRPAFLAPLNVPAIADACETVALPTHGSRRSRSRRQRSNKDNRGRSPSSKSVKSPCASPQQLMSPGSPTPKSPSAKSVKSPCTGAFPQQIMSSGSPTPKFTASNIGVRLVGAEAASLHTHAAALERKAARLQQRSDQMASPARPTVHELVNEWQRLKQRSDEMMVMHEHLGTWISSVQSLRTRGDCSLQGEINLSRGDCISRGDYSLQPHADARELPPTAVEEEPESAEAEDADDEESAVQMHLTLTIPNECSAQDADDAGAGPRRQWQPPSCPHAAPKSARRGTPAKAGEDERRAERRAERQERIRRACKLEGISTSKWISRAITLRFDLEAALLNAPIVASACTLERGVL